MIDKNPVRWMTKVLCLGGVLAGCGNPTIVTTNGSTADHSSKSSVNWGGSMSFANPDSLYGWDNDALVSQDQTKILTAQDDGNLVLYCAQGVGNCNCNNPQDRGFWLEVTERDGSQHWYHYLLCAYAATGTHKVQGPIGADSANYLRAQTDGNLVLYYPGGNGNRDGAIGTRLGPAGVLPSGTNGKGSKTLTLQNDGNLVDYDQNNHALWATGTSRFGTYEGLPQCPNYEVINGLLSCFFATPLGTVSLIKNNYFGGEYNWGAFFQNGASWTCFVPPGTSTATSCRWTSADGHAYTVCDMTKAYYCTMHFDGSCNENPNGTMVCSSPTAQAPTSCNFYDHNGTEFIPNTTIPGFQIGAMFPPEKYGGLTIEQQQELRDNLNELAHAKMEADEKALEWAENNPNAE